MKVCAAKLDLSPDKGHNVSKAVEVVKAAAKAGAEIVSLPELFDLGPLIPSLPPEQIPRAAEKRRRAIARYLASIAEEIPGPTTQRIAKAARENGVCVVAGSICEREGNCFYNSCAVISSQGELVGVHRKTALAPAVLYLNERELLTPGKEVSAYDVGGAVIGVAICYEAFFPEIWKKLVDGGAEIVFCPNRMFGGIVEAGKWVLAARAFEYGVYVAASSVLERVGGRELSCLTAVAKPSTNPSNSLVLEAGSGEKLLFSEVDLDWLRELRRCEPSFESLEKLLSPPMGWLRLHAPAHLA